MKEKHLNFGQRVQHTITGFVGIVVNISKWNNGCVNVGVMPEKLKDGLPQEVKFLDIQELKIMKENVHPAPTRLAGGPKQNCKLPV